MKNTQRKVDYSDIWSEKGDWGEDFKIYGPSSRHTRRIIRILMKGISYGSLIDIGCGAGNLLESLDLKGKKFMGVELSKSGLAICKKKMPHGRFEFIDIEKTHTKEIFDLGICSEVLEHIKDDQKAIKNLRKMCRQIIITVPAGSYGEDDRQMGHYRRYTHKEMKAKLEKAGFKVVRSISWGFPFYSPLYRLIMNNTKQKKKTGKFSPLKRFVSEAIYYLFFLNVYFKGDRLFVLAR